MIEKVLVNLEDDRFANDRDAGLKAVQDAVAKNGNEAKLEDGSILVYVHDAHDALDEVTDALNDAAVSAYVEAM